MRKYTDFIEGTDGKALRGASVLVLNYSDNLPATLYSDDAGLAVMSNPTTTDARGQFSFYVTDGRYTLQISGAGLATAIISDVSIFDEQELTNRATKLPVTHADYTALRAYAGTADQVFVLSSGIAGTFTRDDADTTSADNGGTIIVASNGKRWKRVVDGAVDVRWFGAKGDGTTDDTAAIQSAVNFAIYFKAGFNAVNSGAVVFIPAGRYRTTDTLHLGYGHNGFTSVILRGEASFGADQSTLLTGIYADFIDRPAINIQGGRRVRVEDLSITGRNLAYLYAGYNSIADTSVLASWFGTDVTTANNTRYAPYAGITIDAYSGTQPGTAYPAVTYPSFLGGGISQYGKNFSSNTTFHNVHVRGFAVGVAQSPYAGPAAGNGDFTTLRDCDLSFNVVAFAAGNEDARNINLFNTRAHFCHTVIDGKTYGLQEGFMQVTAVGCSFDNTYRLLNVELDGGAASDQGAFGMSFDGCYSEACKSLGTAHAAGTGSAFTPLGIAFKNCKFAFVYKSTEYTPTYILDAPGVDVLLENVALYGGYNFLYFNANVTGQGVYMDGVLNAIGTDTAAKRVAASFIGGLWANKAYRMLSQPADSSFFGYGGESVNNPTIHSEGFTYPFAIPSNVFLYRGTPIPWYVNQFQYGSTKWPVTNLPALTLNRATYNLSSLTKSTAAATFKNDYTFTVADTFVSDLYGASVEKQFAVNSGDVCIDTSTGLAYFVAGIVHGAGTIQFRLRQLTGLMNSGTSGAPVWEAGGNMSANTGSLVFYNARRFYPTFKRVVATTTAAAATVTCAITGSEVTTDSDVPANTLFVGVLTTDYVISSPKAESPIDSIFPYGKVNGVNSTTGVITLTQNARRNYYGDAPLFVKGSIAGTAP